MKLIAEVEAAEPPLNLPKYCWFTDAHEELYIKSLIVTTEIGVVVLGTTAKLVVSPVFRLVNKNANASEN